MSILDPTEEEMDVGVLERETLEIDAKDRSDSPKNEDYVSLEGADVLPAAAIVNEETVEPGSPDQISMVDTEDALDLQAIIPSNLKRRVSGIYKSCTRPWELILRPDIDGNRPMRKVSGDFNRTTGSTQTYFGSFVMDSPMIGITSNLVTITGVIRTTWRTSFNRIKIQIPRHTIYQPAAAATVQFLTATNRKGSKYTCLYDNIYFRTVQLEQDYEVGVTPFRSYNTGSLPSGGPSRNLTVARSYAEAGILIQDTRRTNSIRTTEAGSDGKWSNAELHFAMQRNFSRWSNDAQWKVWLFHAMKHEIGPGLYGIMFDQKDKQRQGCAAFYQGVGGSSSVKLRDQLYVTVHELGHCFNLFHSFQKRYTTPPIPNRPAALSWMNYPGAYPGGGAAAFWASFAFQFDNLEITHLRHAFRNNIIFGGNNFGIGAALEDPQAFSDIIDDQSGLELTIDTDKTFALGEPVVIVSKLGLTDTRGKKVHRANQICPNTGCLQIAIQKPSGQVYAYEPPIELLVNVETTSLSMDSQPAIYNSSYIGYDKNLGQVFDQPGVYKIRAVYYSLDGSEVLSNITRVTVRVPISEEEKQAAELMLGDDQGMLMLLQGSESPYLKDGNEAIDTLLEKYPNNPLATYARLAKGSCLSREFKTIADDGAVTVRKANIDQATELLNSVVTDSKDDVGLDNISLNSTMTNLAKSQAENGKKKEAQQTLKQINSIFQEKKLNTLVLAQIKSQTDSILDSISKGA